MGTDRDISEHRDHLVRVGYRMLGSVADAEEIAQETYVRWARSAPPELDSPRAWLTRVATRLCIDRLRSPAYQREWTDVMLPEPLVEDPPGSSEIDETLSMALLAAIQRLTPRERAVFLLHDVFGTPLSEVAETLEVRADACRQIAVRARRRLAVGDVRSDESRETVERITEAFFRAIETQSVELLRETLSADVVLRADGGGRVSATRKPIVGRDAVDIFVERLLMRFANGHGYSRRPLWFNGAPGVLVLGPDQQPETAFHFLVRDGLILRIYAQRDPNKIARLGGVH